MMLADHFKEVRAGRRIRAADIMREARLHFGLSEEDFLGPSRVRMVARPRQIAMYIARGMTPQSYPRLGALFKRDQSSIRSGVHQIDALIEKDAEIYDAVIAITYKVVEKQGMIG